MKRLIPVALLLALVNAAGAVDLKKIDRRIDRLPELTSSQPAYCLLVFGPQAATRVWLVRDGDVLYVDRNGNGDLTEPGERVEADPHDHQPAERGRLFQVGEIRAGDALHKYLRVTWSSVEYMKDKSTTIRRALERDPDFLGCRISIDMELPGYHGRGVDGRVPHAVSNYDEHGPLQFASSQQDAPVVHFGGPWTVTLTAQHTAQVGRQKEVVLIMGTPGLGPGTTTRVAYDGVVPDGLNPKVVALYASPAGSPIRRQYDLSRRCCTYNLYGDVRVPDEAATGTAQWEISLEGWAGAEVASSTHEVTVLPAQPGPVIQPVSPRLSSKLEHAHPGKTIVAIRFAPDGQQLIAGDYPGGTVHVWDVASGQRRTTVETGNGLRSTHQYFAVSPDWKTLIAPSVTKREFSRFERDGKKLTQATYNDAIHVWDLDSGRRLHTWQHDPPRSISAMEMSPDGKRFFTHEEVPGVFERRRPRALSLWETATGDHRQVATGDAYVNAITGDGRLAAAAIPGPADDGYHAAIEIYDIPAWQPKVRIPLDELCFATAPAFADAGRIVIGMISKYRKRGDWQNATRELKLWDVASGDEILSIPAASDNEGFRWTKTSPDGRTVAASMFDPQRNRGRVLLIDAPTRSTKSISFGERRMPAEPVFHPDGQWLAIATTILPAERLRRNVQASELEQPRIVLVDVATAAILEELVAPQCFLNSLAFSPDGQTLATSGSGEVLLWDFHSPPGQLGTPPEVGQRLEIAGALVGGKPLDAAAISGKVVLVDYWATWCQPCVAKLPELRGIYQRFRERGFEIVGVSLDDHDAKLDEFVTAQGIAWPIVRGTSADDSGLQHPLAVRYAVDSVPKSFLLDRRGSVAAIDPPLHELPKLVEKLLNDKPAEQAK